MGTEDIYNCEHVNNISIVDFLERIGYQPKRIKGNQYWYYSPFRDENEASFKVDIIRNQWFDFGSWQGGSLVDLGVLYYDCEVKDFLRMVREDNLLRLQVRNKKLQYEQGEINDHKLEILSERELSSYMLYEYLKERAIPLPLARKFCKEISYQVADRKYFAIGFRNNSGGYELRNKIIKISSSPKDITTFENGNDRCAIFEGFFDFLSYLVLNEETAITAMDFIVLNTISFIKKALKITPRYKEVLLFLDNDNAGQNCSRELLATAVNFKDESSLYKDYNDLNDYLHFNTDTG